MSRLGRTLRNQVIHPPFWANDDSTIWSSLSNGDRESISNDYSSYIRKVYKASGPVYASMLTRQMLLSEARFLWRERTATGRPGQLMRDQQLGLIERPWKNGTTGHLLTHMDQKDVLAGNYYGGVVTSAGRPRIRNFRPDWMNIITGSPSGDPHDPEAEVVAYVYEPKIRGKRYEPVVYTPEQIIHYFTTPDPEAQWRGMSPLTPILEEVSADKAATRHKLNFFRNGAMPGIVITYPSEKSPAQVEAYAKAMAESHAGVDNAYKALHIGGGADPKAIGANLQQLDFKVTQGGNETRIAQVLRVHPVIVGMAEAMEGASLNAGNFNSAKRLLADGTARPIWRGMAAALESVLNPPADYELWYDDRDISFLRDDAGDEAGIRQKDAFTLKTLIDAGFTPESAKDAVASSDWNGLEHTGLFSVQLQRPGTSGNDSVTTSNTATVARLLNEGWTITSPATTTTGDAA